jgi:hypothetical protein
MLFPLNLSQLFLDFTVKLKRFCYSVENILYSASSANIDVAKTKNSRHYTLVDDKAFYLR